MSSVYGQCSDVGWQRGYDGRSYRACREDFSSEEERQSEWSGKNFAKENGSWQQRRAIMAWVRHHDRYADGYLADAEKPYWPA